MDDSIIAVLVIGNFLGAVIKGELAKKPNVVPRAQPIGYVALHGKVQP